MRNRKIAMFAMAALVAVALTALGLKFTGISLSVAADKHSPQTPVASEKHDEREESSPPKEHAKEGRAVAGKDSHEGESEEEHKDEKVL